MALRAQGSRLLKIGEGEYRWRVRHKPTYSQGNAWTGMIVAVQSATAKGAVLIARLPEAHPGNWMGEPAGSVTPARVAALVEQALSAGWQPARPGPRFALSLAS